MGSAQHSELLGTRPNPTNAQLLSKKITLGGWRLGSRLIFDDRYLRFYPELFDLDSARCEAGSSIGHWLCQQMQACSIWDVDLDGTRYR